MTMHSTASLTLLSTCAIALALNLVACKKQDDASVDPGPSTNTDAPTGPAIWTVRDADTTVYLFGTVHVLQPETQWRSPALEAAFDEASIVYFEADVSSATAQAKMIALMPEIGVLPEGKTLSSLLDPEATSAITEAFEFVGMPMAMFEPMQPWLVAMTLESQAMAKRGYDPNSGVEKVLGDEATAAGKQLRYLETLEEQLGFFAGLPEADQIEFLTETAKAIQDEPEALDTLVATWASGDVAKLAELISEEDAMGSEAITEVLLTNRNRNWVGQLQALLADEPGVFFVAVGAAHLAGEDGVPTLLRAAGVEVTGP